MTGWHTHVDRALHDGHRALLDDHGLGIEQNRALLTNVDATIKTRLVDADAHTHLGSSDCGR
jgi:hypothetical protein